MQGTKRDLYLEYEAGLIALELGTTGPDLEAFNTHSAYASAHSMYHSNHVKTQLGPPQESTTVYPITILLAVSERELSSSCSV